MYMYDTLIDLGLQDKEAELYLLLLKTPRQTAGELAEQTDIKRTNVYRLLDSLVAQELVASSDSPVKRFYTTEPQKLESLLRKRQLALKQSARLLSTAMPDIKSQYALSTSKPGVTYMAGNEGFIRLLENMLSANTEVLLVASNDLPSNLETLRQFRELLAERRSRGIPTRALFHDGPHRERIRVEFADRGIDVRFIGETPFHGEVVLYDDNTAFTVYDPSLIVTIVTNAEITDTMRQLFEQLWSIAKC